MDFPFLILPVLAAIAFLYGSVGHGGASGYLAVFALWGLASPQVSATVLAMNIVVSGLALAAYLRHSYFSLSVLWPFLITSIPASFAGAWYSGMAPAFEVILGMVLILAALRFWVPIREGQSAGYHEVLRISLGVVGGAVIGFVSGMIGIGGGIFLSPLVIALGLADVKTTAGIAAAFVLSNSVMGVSGHLYAGNLELSWSVLPILTVAIAGWGGAVSGASVMNKANLQKMLSLVMLVAGIKMLL